MRAAQSFYNYHVPTGQTVPYKALEDTLGPVRLAPYSKMAGTGNHELALRLYSWNGRIADELRFSLELAEIALRTRMLRALHLRFDGRPRTWIHPGNYFRQIAAQATIDNLEWAVAELPAHKQSSPDQVAEKLSFGFWTTLLEERFRVEIWDNSIDVVFPHLPKPKAGPTANDKRLYLEELSRKVRGIRNSVAHHDPVFNDAGLYLQNIIELARACCPATARWIEHHSNLDAVLKNRPSLSRATALSEAGVSCLMVNHDETVADVLQKLANHNTRRLVIVALDPCGGAAETHAAISGDDISVSIGKQAEISSMLADLSSPIGDILGYGTRTPIVAHDVPPEGAAEQVLSAKREGNPAPRAALISAPQKKPADPPVLAELTDLLKPEMVRRLVIG